MDDKKRGRPTLPWMRWFATVMAVSASQADHSDGAEGAPKNTKESQNETFDAILLYRDVDVVQQSNFDPREFHGRQPLSLMDPFHLINAPEFNEQLVFDQNFHTVSTIEPHVFVLYRLSAFEARSRSRSVPFRS